MNNYGNITVATRKWDEWYDLLADYVEERRKEEAEDMISDQEKAAWIWDGNVPLRYRNSDGKALGKWVYQQRDAKRNKSLIDDREVLLLAIGLDWTDRYNPWQDMVEELKSYVLENTKDGRVWDGNVPKKYKTKGSSSSTDEVGEVKNLGKWISNQRVLYRRGTLLQYREAELESIGLKWSIVGKYSWLLMYETFVEYVHDRKIAEGNWDGTVPRDYKTNHSPPRSLGKWIVRQRAAYRKRKLTSKCVDKLNSIGLKWTLVERQTTTTVPPAQQHAPSQHSTIHPMQSAGMV